MNEDDAYRWKAAEARHWADHARTSDERASWLRIAQGWLDLLEKPPATTREGIEACTKERGSRGVDETKS